MRNVVLYTGADGCGLRMPSKAVRTTASEIIVWSVASRGRYHSLSELTSPNNSRLVIAGSTSGRTSPSATAWATRPATMWSNWRRRERAARSTRRVAVDAEEQGDEGQALAEHADAPAHQLFELGDGRTSARCDVVDDGEQPVEGVVEGELEQLLLAGDVVIDRRLGDAQPRSQVVHPRSVVAALVEHLDGDIEQPGEVVARATAASWRRLRTPVAHRRSFGHDVHGELSCRSVRLWPRNSATTVLVSPSWRDTVTS